MIIIVANNFSILIAIAFKNKILTDLLASLYFSTTVRRANDNILSVRNHNICIYIVKATYYMLCIINKMIYKMLNISKWQLIYSHIEMFNILYIILL